MERPGDKEIGKQESDAVPHSVSPSPSSSSSSVRLVSIERLRDGQRRADRDAVVIEEPLEIRIGGTPLVVTMRTPGHDEELAAGFLFTEGIAADPAFIERVAHCRAADSEDSAGNVVVVELDAAAAVDLEQVRRNFHATSSCGICGKASIEQVRQMIAECPGTPVLTPHLGTAKASRGSETAGPQPALPHDPYSAMPNPQAELRVSHELVAQLPARMLAAQQVFGHTGGLHAAALFSSTGELLCLREDVGRHNAVDKIVGWTLLEGRLPLAGHILMISGRAGFEIVQKAAMAHVPLVAAVSAASSLAVTLAAACGITLVGFLRDGGMNIYTHPARIQ